MLPLGPQSIICILNVRELLVEFRGRILGSFFFRFLTIYVFSIFITVYACSAHATFFSLKDAISASLANDPALLAAEAQLRADLEALPQARAALLPRVTAQSTTSRNNTSTRLLSGAVPDMNADYQSRANSLVLSQPLFRRSALLNMQKAEIGVDIAQVQYRFARQQAIDRLVVAYAEILRLHYEYLASEAAVEAKASGVAALRQLYDARQRGLVERRTAEAQYALEGAQRNELRARLEASTRELARLTGGRGLGLGMMPALPANECATKMLTVLRSEMDTLEILEIDQHPSALLSKLKLEQAILETRKRESEHYPTVDLVASINRGTSASELTIGRQINTQYLGIQVNAPIFSGGGVSSSVREAVALREKAEIDLNNSLLKLKNDRELAHAQIAVAIAQLEAELASFETASVVLDLESRRYSSRMSSLVDFYDSRSKLQAASARIYGAVAKMISEYSRLRLLIGNLEADMLESLSAKLYSCTIVQGQ